MKPVIALLLISIILIGCGSKQATYLDLPKSHAIDADKNGIIDDKDILIAMETADSYFASWLQPFIVKAGMKDKNDLVTEDADLRLRSNLTVTEWETFNRNMKEYNRLEAQLDATAKESADRMVAKKTPIFRAGKVAGCGWGQIGLQDGLIIKYAGIRIPVGSKSKYSKMVGLLSNKLIQEKIIKYELTGTAVGSIQDAYIYVNDVCINDELVKRGYAIAIRENSDKAMTLIDLENEAKELKRGLWAFSEDDPFKEPLY